jgi:hypothetical protein
VSVVSLGDSAMERLQRLLRRRPTQLSLGHIA